MNKKLIGTGLILFILLAIGFGIQSCSNDKDELESFDKTESVNQELINKIEKSQEMADFLSAASVFDTKFEAYLNNLSDEKFDELIYNVNNNEYMTQIMIDADVSVESAKVAENAEILRTKTSFMDLSVKDQIATFNHLSPLKANFYSIPRLKTSTESGDCKQRYEEDMAWAQGIYTVVLAGCGCAILSGVGCVAGGLCVLAAKANYLNDVRLADRAYQDCIR